MIYSADVLRFLENSERFDLIFIDPPYDTQLVNNTLNAIIEFDKLNANGIIICETKIDFSTPVVSLPYSFEKEYRYGGVKIMKLTKI